MENLHNILNANPTLNCKVSAGVLQDIVSENSVTLLDITPRFLTEP